MPFDLGSAQDVEDEAPAAAPVKRKFDLSTAQDVSGEEPGYLDGLKQASQRVSSAVNNPLDAAKGFVEGAANLVTNVVAPIPTVARRILSGLGLAPDDGSYAKARNQFVYEPRSEPGQAVTEQNAALLKPIGDFIGAGTDKAASGIEAVSGGESGFSRDVREGGADLLAAATTGASLGRGAAAKTPNPVPTAIAKTPEQVARAAGLKILPSQADSAPLGTVAETIGGSPRLAKALSKANATQVESLLVEELGLPKGAKLTPEQFKALREPLNAAYQAVSEQIGTLKADPQLQAAIRKAGGQKGLTPNRQVLRLQEQYAKLDELPASQLVQEIRTLRENASANIKTPFGVKDRVQLQRLGKAQQEIANALDDMLERGAQATGKGDLVKQYKDARVSLAKIGTVERATQAPGGAAASLLKQQNKGAPLTGRTKIIADSARAFPEVMGKPPVQSGLESAVDTVTLGLRGAVASPIIRKLLESNAYQNSIGRTSPTLGPGSALGAYFDDGRSGLPARGPKGPIPEVGRGSNAGSLAGDLELAPDGALPGAPAYGGPPLRASALAGDLGLVPDALPPIGAPRLPPTGRGTAAGDLAGDLQLVDDAQTVRPGQYTDDLAGDLQLAPEQLGDSIDFSPTAGVSEQFALQQLAKDLGLMPELQLAPDNLARVVPSEGRVGSGSAGTVRPGQYDVAIGNDRVASFGERGLADELIEGLDRAPELPPRGSPPEAPAPAVVPRNTPPKAGSGGASLVEDLLAGDPALMAELQALVRPRSSRVPAGRGPLENNASGESAASVEAINRVTSEKAAGRTRYVIDADGAVTTLVGVDSVDAVARPGQVIVQRGVGSDPYTVLDRGGVPANRLQGIIARARGELDAL
jgi:hypothetical protein